MNANGPPVDDSQLIAESLAGDTDAFGSLVSRYQDRLFNSLAHYLRNEAEAEDVAQEAFILSYTRLRSFKGNSSFYTWLYRIALNTAISRRRRARSHVSVERDLESSGKGLDGSEPDPGFRMELDERARQLMAALGRLNDEHRVILVLREMDELGYEDISEILNIPVGTVRSRLHRARSQLKDELADYFQGYETSPPASPKAHSGSPAPLPRDR